MPNQVAPPSMSHERDIRAVLAKVRHINCDTVTLPVSRVFAAFDEIRAKAEAKAARKIAEEFLPILDHARATGHGIREGKDCYARAEEAMGRGMGPLQSGERDMLHRGTCPSCYVVNLAEEAGL